ncbi:threonine ammonia-lyase, biosynthetic [Kiritimatiellaeota bacterium B1221]|nr:threonine ammonia-lyase, biosynthetic [Kiritimatiellaeota bacterium B1221]
MQRSSLLQSTLDRILKARVYDVAVETSLEPAPRLSERLGAQVFLKREDTQPVFSFKIRGAYNRIRLLSESERARGVICASAGNHAQGVALSSRKLGIKACIVMPSTTPRIKVDAVKKLGGDVVLFGDSYQEAQGEAERLRDEKGLVYIHPYDDPEVIAGQGTIALEILRQHGPEIDAVFIPVGGGGLLAGVGACLKALYPEIRIVGVEPDDAAGMTASLAANEIVELKEVGLFADGVAVKKVGKNTFDLCREVVDEMVTVNTDAICAAIKDVFEDTRTILEPAGALSVAGCKSWRKKHPEGRPALIALTCGANMNFDRLRHVAERAEFGEEREALLAVTIPEKPGSFKKFSEVLGDRGITEFNYRYARPEAAQVFVGVQVGGREDIQPLIDQLEQQNFRTLDLTGDEFAKLHLRHLVGGMAPLNQPERLFRFEFPERPGALARFLESLPASCNVTLFHYRNQGADIGRVLAGLQVPEKAAAEFGHFLENLGYGFVEETGNPAAELFL